MGLSEVLGDRVGVITGEDVYKVFRYAQEHNFAIPAINAATSEVIVAALEAARAKHAPIIIETSQTDSVFWAGCTLPNDSERASTAGSIAAAHFVRSVSPLYKVPVILHTDHCKKHMVQWLDQMLKADEKHFEQNGEPLWSSHMLDLSEDDKASNIATCVEYLKRMAPMDLWLEIELGTVGEAHHALSDTSSLPDSAFTQPEDVLAAYTALSRISRFFTIAVAFGNVHGRYREGNVKLQLSLLDKHQKLVASRAIPPSIFAKPVFLVFHGGSGTKESEFREAIAFGTIKVNINADTQFAYMSGIRQFMLEYKDFLITPVGNSDDKNAPNKKYYDTRRWIQSGQRAMTARVEEILTLLNTAYKL